MVARRMVPEPWASGGALLVGLSPPALAHATARLPRGRGGHRPRGRRAVRAASARAAGARQCRSWRCAARRAAVAGAEVPAAGGAGRRHARALDGAPRPPDGRARGGRGDGGLDRRLRDDQRPPVRRLHALRRVGIGAQPDRGRLGRGPRRAAAAAGRAVDRPRRRAAALGAGARASACSRRGCCGARGARTSHGWSRRAPTPSGRRWRSPSGRRCSSSPPSPRPRSPASGSQAASSSPGSRWRRRSAPGACATPRAPARSSARSRSRRRLARARVAFGGAAGWADHGGGRAVGAAVDLLPRWGVGSAWFGVVAGVLGVAAVSVVGREWWRERRFAAG